MTLISLLIKNNLSKYEIELYNDKQKNLNLPTPA